MEMTSDKKSGSLRKSMGHALGRLGNSLGFGLPKSNPEEPRDTAPNISPKPKVEQHGMTDRENPESNALLGDTFDPSKAMVPRTKGAPPEESVILPQGEGGQEQKEAPFPGEPKSFLKLQLEKSAESLKYQYSDIFVARSEDNAEIERRNKINVEDALTFGLSRPGYDPYRQLRISREEDRKTNLADDYDEDLNMPRDQDLRNKEGAQGHENYQQAVAKYPDYIRLSPLAMNPDIMKEVADPVNWLPRSVKGLSVETEQPDDKVIGLVGYQLKESLPGRYPGDKPSGQSWRDTAENMKQAYETGKTELKRGRLLSRQNELNFQELNGDDSQELQDQLNENQAKLDALSVRSENETFWEGAGKDAANWIGDVSDDVLGAVPKAVEGGAVGAAMGARLPIPHPAGKVITATGGALLGAAMDAGAYLGTETLTEQIGDEFKKIKSITDVDGNPVGKEVARNVSLALAGTKAAIDLASGKLTKLVPGLDKGLDKIFLKATEKFLKSEKLKALTGKAVKELGQGATEVGTGLVQGMNQVFMEEVVVAMEQENGREFTPKQRGDVMEIIFKSGIDAVPSAIVGKKKREVTGTISNIIND